MITTFKERPSGGFYCSECRMSFGELHTTCPYCGSYVTNYEDLLLRENPATYATGGKVSYEDSPLFRGWRQKGNFIEDYMPPADYEEILQKIIPTFKKGED